MEKIAIYFIPGLAAGPEIFENLNLSKDKYNINYLEWIEPLALEESITNYAMRMCEEVKEKHPVLVGVSFIVTVEGVFISDFREIFSLSFIELVLVSLDPQEAVITIVENIDISNVFFI